MHRPKTGCRLIPDSGRFVDATLVVTALTWLTLICGKLHASFPQQALGHLYLPPGGNEMERPYACLRSS